MTQPTAPPPDYQPLPGSPPGPGWAPPQGGWPAAYPYAPAWPPQGPDAATRFFGWVRCVPGRLQRAATVGDRKPSGWEIWILLFVFPGVGVSTAVVSLIQTLNAYSDDSTHSPDLLPHHGGLSAFLLFLLVVWDLAPAVLAWYFLQQSGGGLRAIGLDRGRVRADLARSGKIVLYAFVPGFVVLGALIGLTPHSDLIGADPKHQAVAYVVPQLVEALAAGVVEEIVVLGFLVHRLEQRGWDGWQLYAVCVAVRISYHLYYGVGAAGLVIWAAMSVFLYRRRRRVLSFVVAHVLWDTQAFLGGFMPHGYGWIPPVSVIAVLVVLWLVGRAPAAAEMQESGVAIRAGDTARAALT